MDDKQNDVAQAIITWLDGHPKWYRQAFKLAVSGRVVSDTEIDALIFSAAQEQGVVLGVPEAQPILSITKEEIEALCHAGRSVVLLGIKDTHNLNNIHDGGSLDFAEQGLTLVYGRNGSGKTGYSRVLRCVCSSRGGTPEVLPNVFSNDSGAPSASVVFQADGEEGVVKWSADQSAKIVFPEVSILDRECSQIEVSRSHDISFAPLYLSMLKTLVDLIDRANKRIGGIAVKENELAKFPSTSSQWAKNLLEQIMALPDFDAVNSFLKTRALDDSEEKRLAEIPGLLAALPEQEIPKLRRCKRQFTDLNIALDVWLERCTKESVDAYLRAKDDVSHAQAAVDLAAQQLTDATDLEGVGTDTWMALWKAAKDYSVKIAYKDIAFPNVSNGARCPLCQQVLAPAAVRRFKTFEEFVSNAATSRLDKCRQVLAGLENDYATVRQKVLLIKFATGVITDDRTRQCIDFFIQKLENSDARFYSDDEVTYAADKLTPCRSALLNEIKQADLRIADLTDKMDEDKAGALVAERDSLQARAWIFSYAESIKESMQHLLAAKSAGSVGNGINTRSVSSLVAYLSRQGINEAYERAFAEEVRFFFKQAPRVSLTLKTSKGATKADLKLNGAATRGKPSSVFSEGELKVLSLAGFFANLKLQQRPSTIVFDDPVTSLDHPWRKKVAERIVRESKRRPVVVLTHDPAFSIQLLRYAEDNGCPIATKYVASRGGTVGFVGEDIPWEALTVKKRLGKLKATQQRLAKLEKDGDEAYDSEICTAYSNLRATWERAVEEILLNGVVVRGEPAVQTKRLEKLGDITEEDLNIVSTNMTKCSYVTEAHDNPSVAPDPLPDSKEFLDDINKLDDWRKAVCKRRERK